MNLFNSLLASVLMHMMVLTWIESPRDIPVDQYSDMKDMGIDYSTLTEEEIDILEQQMEILKQELRDLIDEEREIQEEIDRLNRDFELDLEDLFRRPNWKFPNGDIEI